MSTENLIKNLSPLLTPSRLNKFHKTINSRTNYISVVLEDIFQSQNASAVVRSCECFGIQNINVIENRNTYEINPDIVLGSTKWINLRKFNESENNTLNAIKQLKKENYRIVATSPHTNDVKLSELNLDKGKIALVFGSELPGISKTIINNTNEFIYIPIYGFTESFNISVSAGICLYELTKRLRESQIKWQLKENEKTELLLKWLKLSIKNSDKIIEKLCSERLKNQF
jgi:tRNA (guanosine-2'-O-)-methyltransferase